MVDDGVSLDHWLEGLSWEMYSRKSFKSRHKHFFWDLLMRAVNYSIIYSSSPPLLLSTRNARNVNWPTKIQRCENVELFSGSGLWSFSGFSFWIAKWTPDQTQRRNELFPRRSVLTHSITGLDATLSLCSITLSLVVWILISCDWAQNRIISSLVLIRTQSNNYIYHM